MMIQIVEQSTSFSFSSPMEKTTNSNVNCKVEYRPSFSFESDEPIDQSAAETPVYSTLSTESFEHCRSNSETSAYSETIDDTSYSSEASPSRWPIIKSGHHKPNILSRLGLNHLRHDHEEKIDRLETVDSELEMMKERFAKLLLGEDMSGSGKGVCTALTISNAITNLYATVFGQNLKLEPLRPEKKAMWKREMDSLLSICDYMVEFFPTLQTLQDGTTMEIMTSKPRTDIFINLPALRKLDAMLLGILDSFKETEFWYAENGSISSNSSLSGSSPKLGRRKEDKWWLPVPCVPFDGLSESSRKHLQQKRDCANQVHKAAMAINSVVLDEMDIPQSYMESLPKCGRTSVGDTIYRHISSSHGFSPDSVLDGINVASEHEALELADRVEASMYTWRRKACLLHSKPSWTSVKDYMDETGRTEKNHKLAERAESLLFCLKQRFPELSQTSLDICKIQYNRDVGQAILESYSRVLEGLAFNVMAWIEDVLYVDRNHQKE
ncbi:hypothetical protein SAY87_030856 [Trapa incisa]|uniref:PRONE domain-containing protein n=1 Tax=Trapa incisa TaxID=236973 RepID=A0AAN7KSF4_9MYRT|nr:hypothetical protein SAY87_030856 [Trapa incisa]